ncbi:hypothetical protein GCM10020331_066910 [Ectobacillus funiculus]
MSKLTLIATAAMGLEALVAKEVRNLGYECQVDNGKSHLSRGRRCGLSCKFVAANCRSGKKIQVGEFKATTFDELFEKNKKH